MTGLRPLLSRGIKFPSTVGPQSLYHTPATAKKELFLDHRIPSFRFCFVAFVIGFGFARVFIRAGGSIDPAALFDYIRVPLTLHLHHYARSPIFGKSGDYWVCFCTRSFCKSSVEETYKSSIGHTTTSTSKTISVSDRIPLISEEALLDRYVSSSQWS